MLVSGHRRCHLAGGGVSPTGTHQRQIRLGRQLDSKRALSASYDDGVLTVTVPTAGGGEAVQRRCLWRRPRRSRRSRPRSTDPSKREQSERPTALAREGGRRAVTSDAPGGLLRRPIRARSGCWLGHRRGPRAEERPEYAERSFTLALQPGPADPRRGRRPSLPDEPSRKPGSRTLEDAGWRRGEVVGVGSHVLERRRRYHRGPRSVPAPRRLEDGPARRRISASRSAERLAHAWKSRMLPSCRLDQAFRGVPRHAGEGVKAFGGNLAAFDPAHQPTRPGVAGAAPVVGLGNPDGASTPGVVDVARRGGTSTPRCREGGEPPPRMLPA